jgi:Transcriptional regulator PadR-like family
VSAIRLLVLGAIRERGRAHGYQARSDLETWGAHDWSTAKPGSIYHALRQLTRQGLLHARQRAPSTAGGPPRVEYELTAGVGFPNHLPRQEAIALLKQRLAALDASERERLTEALASAADLDAVLSTD